MNELAPNRLTQLFRNTPEGESDIVSYHSRYQKGFSLIELLVVVAIVMILMSLLLPAAFNARNRGEDLSCRNNLRSMAQAIAAFSSDHEGLAPGVGEQGPFGLRYFSQGNYRKDLVWPNYAFVGIEVWPQSERRYSWWIDKSLKPVGLLAPYLGIAKGYGPDQEFAYEEAHKLYRCPSLEVTPSRGGGSNGFLDYAMFQYMGGAKISQLSTKGRIVERRGRYPVLERVPPLIVEEDPNRGINVFYREPQHGNGDGLAANHEGFGNYIGTDLMVHSFDTDVEVGTALGTLAQPNTKDWYIRRTPNEQWLSMKVGRFGDYNLGVSY